MVVHKVSMGRMVAAMRRGEVDVLEVVDHLCARLERVEPEVHALLPEPDRRERLRQASADLLLRWPVPENRPPLFGTPIGVKDIFHASGFVTRAGTALPPELFAGREARVVTTLKQAGALIVGKTVTTEFAHAEPGPTRNPHNLAHTPGGSSSGSAAAVACGTCFLALGTQTIGSVIRPAAFCGIVGVKPSYDRISTAGLVFFSRSADHVGFFTQDVPAALLAARILYSTWHEDRELWATERPVLGVPVGPYLEQAGPEALATLDRQLGAIESAGYRIVRVSALEDISEINQRHRRMTAAEAAAEHSEWFSANEHLYRPRTVETLRDGLSVGPSELAAARAGQVALRSAMTDLMRREQIDIWACPPAVGVAPSGLDSTGDPIMNLPWTHAGMPAINLPGGIARGGLPWGLQLVAAYGHDEQLLAWAQGVAEVVSDV